MGNVSTGPSCSYHPSLCLCRDLAGWHCRSCLALFICSGYLGTIIFNNKCFRTPHSPKRVFLGSSRETLLIVGTFASLLFPFSYCSSEAGSQKGNNITDSPVVQKGAFMAAEACQCLPSICITALAEQ